MQAWVSIPPRTPIAQISLDNGTVGEAIEECKRCFQSEMSAARFAGRTLGRDSDVPPTTRETPLELFEGILYTVSPDPSTYVSEFCESSHTCLLFYS